ncbi:MAG: hypothetical protein JEZ05_08010 [Tenericutes bacterium]|nr:hypothetical protein [Mycoplasmatota bacterium]
MIQYDCIVNSNNLYGLTVALFLARKMRKVLVIQDYSKSIDNSEEIDFTDPENKKYHFSYNSFGITSGMDTNGLLYEYLDDLGLVDELSFTKIFEDNIIGLDNKIKRRIHTFDQLKVYLVRNYPKSRDEIHRFFDDLDRHYNNYVSQNINLLRNNEYTLSSLMIEWGDYSLAILMKKYFTAEDLRDEFLLNNIINGLNPKEVNSYNFFSNYFMGLKKGFYYLMNSEKELREKLIKKLELINPKMIIKTRISEIVRDEQGKIKAFVDKDKKEYSAKFFFVEKNPIDFYEFNFKGLEEDIDIIKKYYPNFDSTMKMNTLYIALNQYPKNLGIEEVLYYFKNEKDTDHQIIKLFNYSLFTNADKRRKQGLICLDYAFDNVQAANKEAILKRLYEVFPKLKKAVVGVRDGKPKPYLTMLSEREYRKNLSVNELINIESYEHIQVFDNLYVGCKEYRPETGYFGIVNQAIVYADKIEDRLYYGDDEGVFHYLNNEEIMTMIKHNYNYEAFEENEIHINFHIGKNNYYIRTKKKNVVVHYGKVSLADLSIYTTNDTLSNLLLKKITFDEVLQSGSLKYRGKKELLFKAVNAFKLDDYQEYDPLEFKKSKYKNLGGIFLMAYFFVYSLVCLLSNYVNAIYFYPAALVLTGLIAYFKIKTYKEVYWFDIFINFVLFVGVVLSIFWSTFNQMRFDDPILAIMALALMISVFSNHPIAFQYTKFDQSIDYRGSTLFKTITNGLTFMWGFIFMAELVGTYITGERYVTVLYNLYFAGIFLMYFYPIIYVNTNIKK